MAINNDLMQPAATITGALLAASPGAMRDPDAIAKVFLVAYRQLEKASNELTHNVVATKTPTAAAASAAAKSKPT